MEKIQEIYVVLENRPKATADLCRILQKKQISIYAVGIFMDTARLYVSDTDKAVETLKEHNYALEVREVLKVVLPNRPGALFELTNKLGNADINIDYLYGALEEKQKKGAIILEVDQPDLAVNLFRSHKF